MSSKRYRREIAIQHVHGAALKARIERLVDSLDPVKVLELLRQAAAEHMDHPSCNGVCYCGGECKRG